MRVHREERASILEVMTMTALEVRRTGFELRTILDLGLPAHVLVNLDGGWTPAWLIGRLHCANGWIALVQCLDATGHEQTVRIPAERVSLPTDQPH